MLDYRIHTFLAVCRNMNFTKAAEELNITQPNVSQHIHWLEESYGQKLFISSGRKLLLTEAGELLRRAAVGMLHEEELLRQQVKSLEKRRNLFFGVTKSINEGWMKDAICRFLEENTECHIRFMVDNTSNLLEHLKDRQLDFAIVEGNFDKHLYDYKVMHHAPFIPVCGAGHRLANRHMRLEELCGERLIIREEGSGSREIMEHLLESHNIALEDFKSIMEIGDISVIKSMLEAGDGVTFVYEMAVKKELDSGSLVRIPLQDVEVFHEFSMVWLKTELFSEYYNELAGQLQFDESEEL